MDAGDAAPGALARVRAAIAPLGRAAVAVSGGVDSATLAAIAHGVLGRGATAFHAVSPAVPPEATARVRALADARGWALEVLEAGEFSDPRYLANPAERCFFCKTNLYGAIAACSDAPILSGTNADDLGDWRPGLRAAAAHGVRHPYVEADVDKSGVRALARALGLDDVAELPASPCLSSRVETGIAIEAPVLGAVHDVERTVARDLAPRTVRCRIRRDAVVIELDAATLARLDAARRDDLAARVAARLAAIGIARPIAFEPYHMGSAFVRAGADA